MVQLLRQKHYTDKGKFTIGNTGDMTQDTGFMGILALSGITVKATARTSC